MQQSNTTEESTLLTCENRGKTYQDGKLSNTVLENVNLTITEGELLAIVGSSGSGKSTLLHLLGALDTPSTGYVHFKNEDI